MLLMPHALFSVSTAIVKPDIHHLPMFPSTAQALLNSFALDCRSHRPPAQLFSVSPESMLHPMRLPRHSSLSDLPCVLFPQSAPTPATRILSPCPPKHAVTAIFSLSLPACTRPISVSVRGVPVALRDQATHALRELFALAPQQCLHGEVHAVAPVVEGQVLALQKQRREKGEREVRENRVATSGKR